MNRFSRIHIAARPVVVGLSLICGTLAAEEPSGSGVAAGEDLSRYGREWEAIRSEWNAEKAEHARRLAEIEKRFPEGPRRQAALEAEQARHLEKSRELGLRRNAIHQKVLEEANRRAASGAAGSSKPVRETAGTKPGDRGYRGVAGDLDAGGGARAAEAVDDVLRDMGIKVEKKTHGGTIEYGDDFNLTINKEGRMGRAGSAAHQTQVGVDARNPETYVSEGMAKDQPGRKAVEVQDHIKKGADALNAPPERVAADPDLQQKMAKSAQKVMNTGTVNDADLERILKETGLPDTPQQFKERMERIKEGRARPGDVTPETAAKLQEATRRIAETATETSGQMADAELRSAREKIAELERKGTPEARAEAQKLREQLVDSQTRITESRAANQEKLGRRTDVDGPGRGPADGEGVGAGRAKTQGSKPGASDIDGPGRVPRDADGPGLKPGSSETPGKLRQAGKVVGDFMEGVMILEQAEKVREGIKEGDETKIAQGLAGEDLGKRTQMEGARDFAGAMGELDRAKKAEVEMAEVSKLRRMGATPQEIEEYRRAKDAGDLEAARKIAGAVRDRGGRDARPPEGLEGGPPMDSGWNARDQAAEGAQQAGSYLKWGLNVVTGGFTDKRSEAMEAADEMSRHADHLDQSTREQVRQSLIRKLAGTGELSVEEAGRLVDQLERGDRKEFDRVVGELREKGAFEKTRGKSGIAPTGGVEIPEADTAQEAKDTLKGLKEGLFDRPASIINSIVEDSLEATVGSDKYANERNAAGRTQEWKDQYQRKYEGLIREGATPEQAREALEGPMGSVNRLLTELRSKRQKELPPGAPTQTPEGGPGEGLGRSKTAKPGDGRSPKEGRMEPKTEKIARDIFDRPPSRTPGASEPLKTEALKPHEGPVNDAGQKVDAAVYAEGDRVVTADGTEWEKKEGRWVKTGANHGRYSPQDGLKHAEPRGGSAEGDNGKPTGGGVGDTAGMLDFFSSQRGASRSATVGGAAGLMDANRQMASAAGAGDSQRHEADLTRDLGGRESQSLRDAAARDAAQKQRDQSWGKELGDAVVGGIQKGAESFGEALGSAAAQKASGAIFGSSRKDSSVGTADDDGRTTAAGAGKSVAPPAGARPPRAPPRTPGRGSDDEKKGGGEGKSPDDEVGGGAGTEPDGIRSTTENPDGTVTITYGCGYSWTGRPPGPAQCPVCGRETASTKANPTPQDTPPAVTPPSSTPPPPPPPERPKKKRTIVKCPCGSTNVTPYESRYGPAYKCAGCGGSIKASGMIYEEVDE